MTAEPGVVGHPVAGEAAPEPILSVSGLQVQARATGQTIVSDVEFAVGRGEAVGIVGESGSGKTTVALSLLGHCRPGTAIVAGVVTVAGWPILTLPGPRQRELRGRRIAYVPQDPSAALNPSMRAGQQLRESLIAHGLTEGIERRVADACAAAHFPTGAGELERWPHQLSGGQLQRLTIAMALICEADIVVMDEPTTGLDVTTQAHILETIARLRRERELAVVYVTHDLAVVRGVADRVLVMHDGRVVEAGEVGTLFRAPKTRYAQDLFDAIPRLPGPTTSTASTTSTDPTEPPPLTTTAPGPSALSVASLRAWYGLDRPGLRPALDDVSFTLGAGRCLAVVGESGSGKTTLLRCLVGLHPGASGELALAGVPLSADGRRRSRDSRRRIQLIPQHPDQSLNPHRTVAEIVGRPLRQFAGLRGGRQRAAVETMLERVRLAPDLAQRLPHQLSGGQKQRVAIARALAAEPDVLLCDEITASLDVGVQASILALLASLRDELGTGIVFVSHDLAVVSQISDAVVVLRYGRVCESGATDTVLRHPRAEYTRELLAAVPRVDQ